MSLRERLDARWRYIRDHSPELREATEVLLRTLSARDFTVASLQAGDRMPEFELPNVEGRFVSSSELLERGPLVVSFFRGDWCPYCTLELQALQEALPAIEGFGATLVAITPDTGAAFAAAKRKNKLDYQVLSDLDNGVGLLFGVIFRVPEQTRDLYLRLGIDLGARHGSGNDDWLLPIPATYVVDRNGIIRHAELDKDFRRRMEPADILRLLRDLAAEEAQTEANSPAKSRARFNLTNASKAGE